MSHEEPSQGPPTAVGAQLNARRVAARVISLIDLTDLNDQRRPDGLDSLVADAVAHGTAAVCVWPEFVSTVTDLLRAHGTDQAGDRRLPLVATVVNFPHGEGAVDAVVEETRRALLDGAHEIDVVLPYRAVLGGDVDMAGRMVHAIADVVHALSDRHLKVILETGELGDADVIRLAARCAIDNGADFVKTSTGKTATSATLAAVDAMIDAMVDVAAQDVATHPETAARVIGLKPSGGIRTVADAARYLELVDRRLGPSWATPATFRFGASGLLADAVAAAS